MGKPIFIIFFGAVCGQYTVPIELYSVGEEDCFRSSGVEGNSDLCIQCLSCTYLYDSDGLEGGLSCFEAVSEELNAPHIIREYCRDDHDGMNDSFENLECGQSDLRIEVYCTAMSDMKSDNFYFQYLLTRGMVGVGYDVFLGPPGFQGFYDLRKRKEGTAYCNTDNCNQIDLEASTTLQAVEQNTSLLCKSCSYVSDSEMANPDCLYDASGVAEVACEGTGHGSLTDCD